MVIDDLTIARALHVLSVVIWIGGVYFVTFVILPVLARAEDALERFEAIELQFTKHARIVVTVAGLSGFYMVHKLDAWSWYQSIEFWWLHLMTFVWLVFTLVLFLAEPLFMHAWFMRRAAASPGPALSMAYRFHLVMVALSLLTIAGAVFGVHG